jgi:hypothetical protein
MDGVGEVINRGAVAGGNGGAGGVGGAANGAAGVGGAGLWLTYGGTVDNSGVILGGSGAGGVGVYLGAESLLTNAGIIRGVGAGVDLQAGGRLVNGAAGTALIAGYIGVYAGPGGVATVITAGTIVGAGGVAVQLSTASDRLVVAAGAVFFGAVQGGGGTLELGGGAVSRAPVAGGFSTYRIDRGGAWNWTGPLSLSASDRLIDLGDLAVSASFSNDGAVTVQGGRLVVSGSVTNESAINLVEGYLRVSGTGVTLDGSGDIDLRGTPGAGIIETGGRGTLTNLDNTIFGAGTIGGGAMTLVNAADGAIIGQGTTGLTLNTGASTIFNAGVIQANGALTIESALANSGKLVAQLGVLTLARAVTGDGVVDVRGGAIDAEGAFTENVTFFGGGGEVELAQSRRYTGAITGFTANGATSLDLRDVGFVSAEEASFSGTSRYGILTIADGAEVARIALIGNFTRTTFVASSDGRGGVVVIGSTQALMFSPHAMAAAMAGMAAVTEPATIAASVPLAPNAPMLTTPR